MFLADFYQQFFKQLSIKPDGLRLNEG